MQAKKLCIGVAEMTSRLGISLSGGYNLVNNPQFYPAKRIGGRIVVRLDELERWLGEQGQPKGGEDEM